MRFRFSSAIAGASSLALSFSQGTAVYAQSIVPDGSTATAATIGGTGRITVDIAAKSASGTSLNRYTDFNVPTAGVDLNNAVVGARTIINEVTGTNPSLILGQLQVLGPRAHVIVANPNGITVDGGSFINTGSVALATGSISFVNRTVAPGVTQSNPVVTTTGGVLTVGPGGLSGTMPHLELIARELRIEGAVSNNHASESADLRVTGGQSTVEFDAGIFPTNVTSPWTAVTSPGATSPGEILVDITRPGGLSASRVKIAVTDAGAGVRSAGTLLASASDFTLSAGGDVRLAGSVQAANDLIVDAGTIAVEANGDGTATSLRAGRHLDLLATQVTVQGASMQAGTQGGEGDITLGRQGIAATGDFSVTGLQTLDRYQMTTLSAPGGFGLYADGRAVTLTGVDAEVAGAAELVGGDMTFSSPMNGQNEVQASRLSTGEMNVAATGDVTIEGFEFSGFAGLSLTANSLTATVVTVSETQGSKLNSAGGDLTVSTAGAIHLTGTTATAAGNSKFTGTSIDFASASLANGAWLQTEVAAQNGGLVAKATAGDIAIHGASLQGRKAIAADPDSAGGVTLSATGKIDVQSLDAHTLAVVFSSEEDLSLTAGGNIRNYAGRLVSNRNVALNAGGDFDNWVTKTGGGNGTLVQSGSIKGGFWSRLFGGKSNATATVDYGALSIPGQLAYVVANGNLAITAANLRNIGGEIDANNGSITVNTGMLTNEALVTGQASVQTSCGFTCRSSAANGVVLNGGTFSASRDLSVTATGDVLNKGGRFLAMDNLTVDAPRIRAEAVTTWQAAAMPMSRYSAAGPRLLRSDRGGAFVAAGGLLRLNTVDPIELAGGTLSGATGIDTPAGTVTISTPVVESPVGGTFAPIGLFH